MSRKQGTPRPLRLRPDGWSIEILDQTLLPHVEAWVQLTTLQQVVTAIATMQVRGAPLIGITAAYGFCLALMADGTVLVASEGRGGAGRLVRMPMP